MKDPVTIKLSQPIHVMGEERRELVFNEPNGGMLARAGSYMRFVHLENGETATEVLPAGMLKLIAASAKIPTRSAEELCGIDFARCQGSVMSFLSPEETVGETSTNDPAVGAAPTIS